MPNLTVIRHSIAIANEQGILMGAKLNSPLSEKGIEVAKAKGESLKSQGFIPDRIYTSKLVRSKQTAEIILQELSLNLVIEELEELNERDFGEHDGKPYKSVLEAFDKYGDNPPTIETVDHFVKRVTSALYQIRDKTTGTTLVVTHSNPVMVMQASLFQPDNLHKFWELGDPKYCEGFDYSFQLSHLSQTC